MNFERLDQFSSYTFEDSNNVKEILEPYLSHFKWFILSVLIAASYAFYKIRNETPKYSASSTILIKEKDKGSSLDKNDLESFQDLGIFSANDNSLENEIHLLKSRRLMKKVVLDLKLNVQYFIENKPYNLEQYPNFPILIGLRNDDLGVDFSGKNLINIATSFKINVLNDNKFEFFDSEGISRGIKEFGRQFKTPFGDFIIDRNELWEANLVGENIIVRINSFDGIVDKYNRLVQVEPIDAKSRVVNISINETIKEKGVAIIKNLIEQYNLDAVDDKNQISKKTIEFLYDRIVLITSELNAIENTVEKFKSSKGLIDTNTGASIFLESSSTNENNLIQVNTQLQLVDFMISELNRNGKNELLPSNIGLSNPALLDLVAEYNTVVLERNRILKSSTEINPLIVNLDNQLAILKSNLSSNLNSLNSSLKIQMSSLSLQSGRINSRIASVPRNEKEYKDIVRQQETKNAVYLFLLQKHEESVLSNAINIDKARIVDTAYSRNTPISPKPGIIYFSAVLIGLLIPAGVIFVKNSLDTKVHDEKDISQLKIPCLGDVPLTSMKQDLYIKDGDSSNIAEAFRYLRTNINFMLDRMERGKTIFVTSTQSHEGKTFTSINLALSLAISGKKTILIALDLRAPKVFDYLKLEQKNGVTNFIKDDTLYLENIISSHPTIKNLDLINSGDIPPNPVELLMNKRVDEIFALVKENYDYIIVDTAPVGMVTDTLQLGKFADMTIGVIRANYLDKRKLHIFDKINRENKLPNMAILINGTDNNRGAYGYGYGYGKEEENSWFKKIFKPGK